MNKSISKIEPPTFQPDVIGLLDFCKGLAITWVFFFHYKGSWFGWQGVHIFITLSGFGLTYSCFKAKKHLLWKHWFVKRAEKILPIYWLGCLVGFMVLVLSHLSENKGLEPHLFRNLILDLLLLRNFFYQTVNSYPAPQLWFIPLIISFYLIFPYLYTHISRYKTTKSYLLILLGAVFIEFIYRAISLYWLDGSPHGQVPLPNLPFVANLPIDKLPARVPFQLSAPFSLFPSRIAEFILGMIGAVALVQNQQNFNNIFSVSVGIIGVFTWVTGNALLYVGLWGWILSDFIINLGLLLWLLNLAYTFQKKLHFLFLKLSYVGSISYYIFLTHFIFIRAFEKLEVKLIGTDLIKIFIVKVLTIGLMIIGTWSASWVVMQVDKSIFPKWIIQKSIARFLR